MSNARAAVLAEGEIEQILELAFKLLENPGVTVHHRGTRERFARAGAKIGTDLVRHVAAVHCSATLQAETDGDAVGFCRRLGFRAGSLGLKYEGVERFFVHLGAW